MAKHVKGCPTECNKELCRCWCHKKAQQKTEKDSLCESRVAISDRTCHNCKASEFCQKSMTIGEKTIELYYCTAWQK